MNRIQLIKSHWIWISMTEFIDSAAGSAEQDQTARICSRLVGIKLCLVRPSRRSHAKEVRGMLTLENF